MDTVKIIPISNEYRENYERIFTCSRCLNTGRIIYGSDTETGTYAFPCDCIYSVKDGVDHNAA